MLNLSTFKGGYFRKLGVTLWTIYGIVMSYNYMISIDLVCLNLIKHWHYSSIYVVLTDYYILVCF